ncbi:MAG TPA: efflux RND transporter periplasmic adaptor subunit [Candidatus Acidoferrum sp.]|nr:efflux RND transporter periplasmic adaptor subunit [Candidatus Acidoferrum sp.]
MNLTRALEVALPDIPARKLAESYPRMDPGTTFKEQMEDGQAMVRIYVPSSSGMYIFERNQWELARLFDGKRSYEEIAELYSQQNGIEYDEETVRDFAAGLESNEFWYKTQQEKNIQLMQLSLEERKKRLKTHTVWADLSDVNFPAFNPDRAVTWVHDHTRFIYTPWFTIVSAIAVLISVGITIAHWPQIWQDSLDFYLWKRTWMDVFYMYTLGMAVVALHEFAHAHACKHYGGRVPAMGFSLVYLLPAFFTDTTEGFVHATLHQRLIISFAGVWSETLLYAVATPIWWGTQPGTALHNGAYFVIITSGFMNVIMNWNPLMKLDGYYMLCDIVGINTLKEDSTAYTSAWIKKYIWRLPVEVPYIPKQRRVGFVVYALVSGAYSYTILYILASFAGNIVRSFSPEWGFIPELGVAAIIFRSRIRSLVNFMKFLYLDKKDRIMAWFTPQHSAMTVAVMALLLAIPFWKESVVGRFVLEPVDVAQVRAHVPGRVSQIYVREGEFVSKGVLLATLTNLPLQSNLDDARAKLLLASAEARGAEMHYQGYGSALMEKERSQRNYKQLSEMSSNLEFRAPIEGTVITPRVQDQLGAYLRGGAEIVEVANLSQMKARIYTSEYDLYKIRGSQSAKLLLDGMLRRRDGQVALISVQPVQAPPWAVVEAGKEANSIGLQTYYFVDLFVNNPQNELKPGMTGIARVYGSRRSMGGMAFESIRNFWGRKLW